MISAFYEFLNYLKTIKVASPHTLRNYCADLNYFKNLMTLKNPDNMIKQANDGGLKKTLGAFDLIILGVGAIIGSGIFTVVGIAAAGSAESAGAGPGLVISMILASLACVFSLYSFWHYFICFITMFCCVGYYASI